MAVISAVPGVLDTRQGYDRSTRKPTEEELAAWERRRAEVAATKHPDEWRRERAENERRREAERRAIDWRGQLRDAHLLRAEARNEVARVEGLRGRAQGLVEELAGREGEALAALQARNADATQALIEAIGNNTDRNALPIGPKNDAAISAVEGARAKLHVARDALHQLEAVCERARQGLAAAGRAVAIAAYGVGVDHAASEAEAIEELVTALQRRRVDLWGLSCGLTDLARQIGAGAVPGLPAAVHRAIGPAADGRLNSAWSARLKRLCEDPETELG